MKRPNRFVLCVVLILAICILTISSPALPQTLRPEQLSSIPAIVEEAILTGQIPGAVILIGNQGRVVYRQAFGHRILWPQKQPMTADTVFDIASITKVVATTTALMQLVEKGKLNLEDPVAKYWPEFRANNKGQITVRHLLTHYSGLRPGLPVKARWSGYETALKKIVKEKPVSAPGACFDYGDTNFAILGEMIRRISGQPLDIYCRDHIFSPLGMKDTCFNPAPSMQDRIAPTRMDIPLLGKVHDPMAYKMGGVSGHAGLFSTADDLAVLAQTLLNGGRGPKGEILYPLSVEKMTLPQSPPGRMPLRGLGWSIHSPSGSQWSEFLPAGSYGHRGFTGTLIWIDPVSQTYLIILTNRAYTRGESRPEDLRAQVLTLVAEALGRVSTESNPAGKPAPARDSANLQKVQTGIDVLNAKKFAPLSGLRMGLITNHSGLDSEGRRTIDLLSTAPRVKLKKIFTPEHGLSGQAERKVSSGRDPSTGLPVFSLYGDTLRPTKKMLKGLDALIFDIQDAGARFYTYMTTMGFAMEAAARQGISFYILDRPNLITGSMVQGPIMEKDLKSFTGYFPLPIRHGMTMGELARMFNGENRIGAKLRVIAMNGYRRAEWYDETGLRWVNPSPNLRSLTQAILYPGVGMVEGTNMSVGRGTNTPFELLGSPWIEAKEFAEYLNSRKIPGVEFAAADFMPSSSCFRGQECHGVKIALTDRQALDSPALGIEIISALYRLYPQQFQLDKTLSMVGARWVLQDIKDGKEPSSIVLKWQEALQRFCQMRSNYLIYP